MKRLLVVLLSISALSLPPEKISSHEKQVNKVLPKESVLEIFDHYSALFSGMGLALSGTVFFVLADESAKDK